MSQSNFPVAAIDAVVNIQTEEALSYRPADRRGFYVEKLGVDEGTYLGISHEDMLRRMDEAGIEKSFLIAPKIGRLGLPATYHLPYQVVADAVKAHPGRFYGLAGIDPFEGMEGVRQLEHAISELGFIGAHVYPH